jgi:hypothetical protein
MTRNVVGAVALLLLAPLAVAAQGLGDASKKEKARREQTKAPKTQTYTQDDLATRPLEANDPAPREGESAPPAVTPAPVVPDADESSRAEESRRREDEYLWRGRVREATARVDKARRAHETLAGLTLVPGYEYQDANGRTVIGSVAELQGMTAQAKAELDAAEKDLADLLEEARRAGVPPGWLR